MVQSRPAVDVDPHRYPVDPTEPELSEIQGYDEVRTAIPVRVEGIVTTRSFPAKRSNSGSTTVPPPSVNPNAQLLFGTNIRRKSATIWVENNDIYFGEDRTMVQNGTAAHLPAGGSVTIEHTDPVYVAAPTAAALVSFIVENWVE
jgi:hypothetical protein